MGMSIEAVRVTQAAVRGTPYRRYTVEYQGRLIYAQLSPLTDTEVDGILVAWKAAQRREPVSQPQAASSLKRKRCHGCGMRPLGEFELRGLYYMSRCRKCRSVAHMRRGVPCGA